MKNKIHKIKVYKLNKAKAQALLEPVAEAQAFHINDGATVTSLEELYNELSEISAVTYLYHANEERNDFANWVDRAIGDSWLADKLRLVETQSAACEVLANHLRELVILSESDG